MAADVESMHAAFGDAIAALGATIYGATGVSSTAHGKAFRTFGNHTQEQFAVINTPETAVNDPLNQYLRTHDDAVYWDREFFSKAGCLDMWQEQADVGPTHGVAIALKLPPDQAFILGLDWDEVAPLAPSRRQVALDAVQVLACCTYAALMRLWSGLDEPVEANGELISLRERQCLIWVGRGHTDQMVGQALGISHRTARKHVDSAIKKLGASSRTHAVAVAIRLGLLQPSDTRTVVHVNPPGRPLR